MTVHRVVLDTNVLVSALVLHAGSLSCLRGAWQSKRILPLASRGTAEELIRVFAYPRFRLSPDERTDLLADYLPWCETVAVSDSPMEIPRCRDPSDRAFLELALAGHADALISGDADLLVLADSFPVPILAPATFKERLVAAPRRPDR